MSFFTIIFVHVLTVINGYKRGGYNMCNSYLERSTSSAFSRYLAAKGSSGSVVFDSDAGTLDLEVQHNMRDESTRSTNVK
jgi:hypothetical protein